MPTIHTQPASVVYEAGKGLGQIEQEQEAFERGMQKAQLELQQKQIRNQRVATALQHISQGRAQRATEGAQASRERVNAGIRETEAERYKSETIEGKRRYEKEFAAGMTESAKRRETDVTRMKEAEYKPTTFEEAVKFEQAKKSTKPLSESMKYKKALQGYEKGDIKAKEIKSAFPEKRTNFKSFEEAVKFDKKREQTIKKHPLIRVSRLDLLGKMRKDMASMNDVTAATETRTYGDLINLYNNQESLGAMGVDLKLLFDHYSDELNELGTQGYLK